MKAKSFVRITIFLSALLSSGCMEKVPLVVTNGLENYNITCVYISRRSDNVWGSNHLPGSDILAPGSEAEVMVRPGTYDLQVTDEDGDTYTLQDVRIGSDGFNWTVTMNDIDLATAAQYAGQCAVTVTNNLRDRNINGVWIAPSTTDSWGSNHIAGEVLYPGDTYTAYIRADTYDISLEDDQENYYSRWDIAVSTDGYQWSVSAKDLD